MLSKSCETLPGIGPTLAAKLNKCGIKSIKDLLFHLPFRYQDRTRITPIQDLRANDWCVVTGTICKTEITFGKRRSLICFLEDKTGVLRLRFFHFNQSQIATLKESPFVRVFGEVRLLGQHLEIVHPEYQCLQTLDDVVVEETLTPIYPSTQGLSQTRLRQLIENALSHCNDELSQLEWMSTQTLQENAFQALPEALQCLHRPPPDISISAIETGTHPSLKRLAFDELLSHRLSMAFARRERRTLQASAMPLDSDLIQSFLNTLPFQLTNAQLRVHGEIANDLSQSQPMLRLVQGDVGAGKTVIAALAALQAIQNGYQVALMAPTDLLSEQHAQTFESWFAPLAISVERLSGKMKARERKKTLSALENKTCQIVVGTHALFQESVSFAQLGLIIIDEQHRFGVEQRLSLQKKASHAGQSVHQLLLTATPIPRTLSMTHFAHLDLSILDELPPGRTPIITAVLNQERRQELIERLKSAIHDGRQVYWVCTLIEDSEKLQCMAATATAETLQTQLPNIKIGLIHGRMKNQEKDAMMMAFKSGDIALLVATTVIEVGVDVPNASLMIIENAERLGLSQLHQLRGRVGRGRNQSHCLLLYQTPISAHSKERLNMMRETNDGFLIAEKDLELRGAGEVLGTRQTGYRAFKIADLKRDKALLPQVVSMTERLLKNDPKTAEAIVACWIGPRTEFIRS